MTRRRLLVVGAAAALAVAVVAAVAVELGDDPARIAAEQPTPTPTGRLALPGSDGGGPEDGAGVGTGATEPGTGDAADGSRGAAGEGPPGASTQDPTVLPGLEPAAGPGPSLTGPLPASGSARGELVAGFPTSVVPVPEGLTVVSSSLSAEGVRLQVTLEGASRAQPEAVTEQYVTALGGAGFQVSETVAVPGSTATAFTRGPDALVLTVTGRLGGGTELSVLGTLSTAG